MRTILVTADHIAILRALHIDDDGFGFPQVNSKRPLGNSNVRDDLAKALGIDPIETDDGEMIYPKGTTEIIAERMKGLPEALEALLRTADFELGEYVADDYSSKWEKT